MVGQVLLVAILSSEKDPQEMEVVGPERRQRRRYYILAIEPHFVFVET